MPNDNFIKILTAINEIIKFEVGANMFDGVKLMKLYEVS